MTTAVATPDDVRAEIDTNLENEIIQHYLDAEAMELSLLNDLTTINGDIRRRLEVLGACLRILDRREKAVASEEVDAVQFRYEQSTISRIEAERTRLGDAANVYLSERRQKAVFEMF